MKLPKPLRSKRAHLILDATLDLVLGVVIWAVLSVLLGAFFLLLR